MQVRAKHLTNSKANETCLEIIIVAYWIAHVDVSDPKAYEAYRKANALAFNKYNRRFIVRGG